MSIHNNIHYFVIINNITYMVRNNTTVYDKKRKKEKVSLLREISALVFQWTVQVGTVYCSLAQYNSCGQYYKQVRVRCKHFRLGTCFALETHFIFVLKTYKSIFSFPAVHLKCRKSVTFSVLWISPERAAQRCYPWLRLIPQSPIKTKRYSGLLSITMKRMDVRNK